MYKYFNESEMKKAHDNLKMLCVIKMLRTNNTLQKYLDFDLDFRAALSVYNSIEKVTILSKYKDIMKGYVVKEYNCTLEEIDMLIIKNRATIQDIVFLMDIFKNNQLEDFYTLKLSLNSATEFYNHIKKSNFLCNIIKDYKDIFYKYVGQKYNCEGYEIKGMVDIFHIEPLDTLDELLEVYDSDRINKFYSKELSFEEAIKVYQEITKSSFLTEVYVDITKVIIEYFQENMNFNSYKDLSEMFFDVSEYFTDYESFDEEYQDFEGSVDPFDIESKLEETIKNCSNFFDKDLHEANFTDLAMRKNDQAGIFSLVRNSIRGHMYLPNGDMADVEEILQSYNENLVIDAVAVIIEDMNISEHGLIEMNKCLPYCEYIPPEVYNDANGNFNITVSDGMLCGAFKLRDLMRFLSYMIVN